MDNQNVQAPLRLYSALHILPSAIEGGLLRVADAAVANATRYENTRPYHCICADLYIYIYFRFYYYHYNYYYFTSFMYLPIIWVAVTRGYITSYYLLNTAWTFISSSLRFNSRLYPFPFLFFFIFIKRNRVL